MKSYLYGDVSSGKEVIEEIKQETLRVVTIAIIYSTLASL